MSGIKSMISPDSLKICTLRILSLYDLWAYFYECDEGVELEYGGSRYGMVNSPYDDYRRGYVFCY